MTPICHIESAPRVPGDSLHGKRPHDYGRGRVCTRPGCTTILRRTHKGPICDPCQDNGRCEQRRSMDRKEREAAVLDYLRPRDGWITSVEMAKALGVPKGTLTGTLGCMVDEGALVSRVPAKGGGSRLHDAVMHDVSEDTCAPDGPSGAAPASSCPPEQPADVAPAPAPETPLEPAPAAGLRPFAGIHVLQMECRGLGRELSILDELEGLDDSARERVLGYAFARWPGKLDIVREVEVRYPSCNELVTEILDTLDRFARTAP